MTSTQYGPNKYALYFNLSGVLNFQFLANKTYLNKSIYGKSTVTFCIVTLSRQITMKT